MGRYRSSIILAGAGLLISVFLIAKGPRLGDKGAAPLRAAAADLDMKQRELFAAVEARATTLAQLPRLSWAVATDEATVRDLTPDELGFRVQPGELIEVAQIQKATAQVTPLLRVPATASLSAPMTSNGPCVLVSGDQLLIAAVVGIEPREHNDVLRGALVVARRMDLEPTISQLIRAGVAARLVTANGSLTLTEVPRLGRQPEITVAVGPSGSLRLVGRSPAPHTGVWTLIGILVLLIWSTAAVVAARRAQAAVALPVAGTHAPPRSTSPTPGFDLPDTTPVLDFLIAERNISASSNGFHGHGFGNGHNGIAGPIVEIVWGRSRSASRTPTRCRRRRVISNLCSASSSIYASGVGTRARPRPSRSSCICCTSAARRCWRRTPRPKSCSRSSSSMDEPWFAPRA